MDRKEVKFGEAAMSLSADLICLQGGGGAEGEAALAMLEKQLICPICLELFNKPVVILPCQHNLCRKCANELYQPSLFQPRTTMQVNSGRFRCPSCRHEVLLDRHGVYGLPRNLLVENIIDVYKQEVNNSSNNTSPAPPPPPPAQVTCADHEGEKVNIYCVSCQVPTCSLCKVFGAHQSCQVAPLTDVYQQQKDELSEEVGSLVVVNDKIQTVINELEETCRNTEDNCKSQKQSVCEKFNQVFSILQERQKALTQRISSEQEEKTGHIRALVRCYGDSVEANNKLLERAVSSMEEADMAAFVQNSRELIKIVVAASGSRPAETLKPGYESLSRYTCDFSRQERALGGIGFLKVVEHVPEEPEVEQEPEEPPEPPEPSVQNTEPDPHQENSTQELESAGEPVKEPIPAPVEPAQKAAPTSTPVQPDPGLVMDSVEPGGAAPEAEASEGESDEKNTMEEEGCEDVNEENICERQEGMSTQQFEGGEETAGKHDAQEDEEEEEVLKEEMVVMLYPSWYKPRVIPAEILPELHDTEQMMCSPHPAGEEPPLVQTVSEPQIQPQPPWSLDSQTQSVSHPNQPENQPQPLSPHESQSHPQTVPEELGRGFTPGPHMQETAEEEPEEEVDLQGWVCLPGAVGGSFDPLERSRSDNLELSDGRLEEAEEEEQHDEDAPGSELEERGLGDFEAAAMNERLEKGGVWSDEGSKMHEKDLLDGLRRTDSFTDGDAEFEALGFTEKEEDGESREQPEDEMETSAAETKGKIASFHFLQALTLLFYLLAFLAILQRFWAYIGCFICT